MPVRKKASATLKADPTQGLPPLNLNAAGIDVGSAEHWVAVPPGRDTEAVRCFHSFTADVHRLADWLHACGIETGAMESTGVYWIGLFQVLEARGFTVHVVDARRAKSLPGRKSDRWTVSGYRSSTPSAYSTAAFGPRRRSVCSVRTYASVRRW